MTKAKTTQKKATKERPRDPDGLRPDGHFVIGSIQCNGITRIDVTTTADRSPDGGRLMCIEIARVGYTKDGMRETGRTERLSAEMSRERLMALLMLLLTAVEEG